MKTFYWLVKREFWEHRGSFLWTPVITAAVVLILNIMGLVAGEIIGGRHFVDGAFWHQINHASPHDLQQAGTLLDVMALMPMGIITIVLFFVLFKYCMHNLSDDRSDRSILFWKSLPVSDLSTVLSKVFSAVVLAPVIAAVIGTISIFLMLLIYAVNAAFHGIDFGLVMWTLPHPGRMIASSWGLLPIYMIWMLPSVGWLMMCSAWASGKVARWAIALPIGLGAVISWFGLMGTLSQFTGWFWEHVALRIVFGIFPGSWIGNMDELPRIEINGDSSGLHFQSFAGQLMNNVGQQYHLLLTPEFLWGILAGAVMIGIAAWLRRWRTEL